MRYYANGRRIEESSGTAKEQEARRIFKRKEGRVAVGVPVEPRLDRITYDELVVDFRRHYETTGDRQLDEVEDHLKPLAPFFWPAMGDNHQQPYRGAVRTDAAEK